MLPEAGGARFPMHRGAAGPFVSHPGPALRADVGVHPAAEIDGASEQRRVAAGAPRPPQPDRGVGDAWLTGQPAGLEDEAEALVPRRARRRDIALERLARP